MQVAEPEVSRTKFDREIEQFRAMDESYRKRGAFLVSAAFPDALILFVTPKLIPMSVAGAVKINFENYDLEPPSVEFVDPLSFRALAHKELRIQMLRRLPGITPENVGLMQQLGAQPMASLIQSNGPDEKPFICLAGIREYHDNPAHTGDPWLLHRNSGEGSLAFILDKILMYGVDLIQGIQIQMQLGPFQISHAIPL